MSFSSEVQEVCKEASLGNLEISIAVSRLKDCLARWERKEASLSISCTLCALWDLRPETESIEEDTPRKKIASLARELWISGALDEDTWLSTCERDLLGASESIGNINDEKTRENRFYTREIYLQTRFNLYSETPAGFARLLSLFQQIHDKPVEILRFELFALVGEMKIEPHRVLDIMLEFLPEHVHPSYELLSLFDKTKIGHIMGRKFRFWKKESAKGTESELGEETEHPSGKTAATRTSRSNRGDDARHEKEITKGPTPQRLFRLCASLQVAGYLDMQVVFPYFVTTKQETQEHTRKIVKMLNAGAHEQRFPNLNKPLPEQRSRATEKDRDVHSVYRDQKKFAYQPGRVLETLQEASTVDDQYLRMTAGFLETNKPGEAIKILNYLTRNGISINDLFSSELTEGLLSLLGRIMDPYHRQIPVTSRSLHTFLEDIKTPLFPSLRSNFASKQVFEWCVQTSYRLYQNIDLFRKVSLLMLHELRFYGNASYSEISSYGQYPSPKRHSVEYVISTVLLPSLLLMECKEGLEASSHIELLLQLCSYSVRVMIFIHFEEVVYRSPLLDRASAMAETATRNIIKILVSSTDSESYETNVVPVIDVLGKIAIRASYQVTQVMTKKVQTDVMAAKDLSRAMLFFTPLAFSAFAHHFVLEIISTSGGRKHDDGHISQWYKNMLSFLGHAAHDYPELLPVHFILQSILKEISNTEIIHVHILRQLLHSMTGFQHCSEIGNNQFSTLSGGPMLKSIGLVTPWQKDEIGYDASAIVLKKSLTCLPRNDAEGMNLSNLTLGGQMFILLVKFLDHVPIRGDFAAVTSIMDMHSIILGTFLAFVEFLSVYCTSQEYSEMLPSMHFMLIDTKLPIHYVAHLFRPCIVELRVVPGGMTKIPTRSDEKSLTRLEKVIHQLCESTTNAEHTLTSVQNEDLVQQDGSMSVDDDADVMSTSDDILTDSKKEPQQQQEEDLLTENQLKHMIKIIDDSGIRDINEHQRHELLSSFGFYDFVEALKCGPDFIEKSIWEVMSPEFYAFFWSLKLNDITISDTEYKKQISQMTKQIANLEHETRIEPHQNEDLILLKHKLESLMSERDLQQTHVKYCRDLIRQRQKHFLSHVPRDKLRRFVDAFVQLCLYPRIRLGHEDALFAFEFVVIMTKMGVENFPTLFILDKVVKELFPCLICMTDNEAEGFANFMYEFLRQMERWRSNKNLFEKEFGSLPGALENPYTPNSNEVVTHSNFLKVMAKWSNVIARHLKECLRPHESETKTNITTSTSTHPQKTENHIIDSVKHRKIMRRPALLVLDRLIPIFPTLTFLAQHLKAALQYVYDHDKDDGMRTSAFTALSRLNAEMESNRPGRWLERNDYNIDTSKSEGIHHQETQRDLTQKELDDEMNIDTERKDGVIDLTREDSKRLKKIHVKESDLELEHGNISTEGKVNLEQKAIVKKEETEKPEIGVGNVREEGELEKSESRGSESRLIEERRSRRLTEGKRSSDDTMSLRSSGGKKPRRATNPRGVDEDGQKALRSTEEHGGRVLPRVNEGGTEAHQMSENLPRRVSSREESRKKKEGVEKMEMEKEQRRLKGGNRQDEGRRKEGNIMDKRS